MKIKKKKVTDVNNRGFDFKQMIKVKKQILQSIEEKRKLLRSGKHEETIE